MYSRRPDAWQGYSEKRARSTFEAIYDVLFHSLITACLLSGLTLRSMWRNDVELGIAVAVLLASLLFVSTPRTHG
jgi:hypothetical protein